jgi:uncharacterized protein (DUF736 family)
MVIGTFDKGGDGYRGRIFSRERCGRVIAFRPIPVGRSGGPDFAVTSETQGGNELAEIGAAWKRTNTKGKPYLLVRLNQPTIWNGAHCVLIEQQSGVFGLLWKRNRQRLKKLLSTCRDDEGHGRPASSKNCQFHIQALSDVEFRR